MAEYERVLLVKNEIFVYHIPPRPSVRGHRAADWKLDAPDWTGRLRILSKGISIWLQLEEPSGVLFAKCPVDAYPGVAVEQVIDSSRYFVIKIQDDNGRSAFIGIGFADRSDSFDILVTLQDHFKVMKRDEQEAKDSASLNAGPKLDLSLKEGETIKININTKKSGAAVAKPRPKGNASGFLPPPPSGGNRIAGPPKTAQAASSLIDSSASVSTAPQSQNTKNSDSIDLLGLDSLSLQSNQPSESTQSKTNTSSDDTWGDFAEPGSGKVAMEASADPWVQF